jgi:transposase
VECYAGIDVSLDLSSVCVVDKTGRIMREVKVPSEPEALVGFFQQLGVPMTRIGLEAGPLSPSAGDCRPLLRRRIERAALDGCTPGSSRRACRPCCWRPGT